MTVRLRNSILFDKPSSVTIATLKIADALYPHKSKLQINRRSKSRIEKDYKTERLNLFQAKTIENLHSKTSKQYSLNQLLKCYNRNVQNDEQNPKRFQTSNEKNKYPDFLASQKLRAFNSGVNYRSLTRARGTGVAKIDKESLKEYFFRDPLQQKQKLYLHQEYINHKANRSRAKPRSRPQTSKHFHRTVDSGKDNSSQWFKSAATTAVQSTNNSACSIRQNNRFKSHSSVAI